MVKCVSLKPKRGAETNIMKALELSSDLLTGIDDIDRMHQSLFDQANRLLGMSDVRDEDRTERQLLEFLAGYIHYHFTAEETLMKNAGIDASGHIQQHDRLRSEIQALSQSMNERGKLGPSARAQLYLLMDDWFCNHIRHWDVKLAQALRTALA
jgi:hemerythrin